MDDTKPSASAAKSRAPRKELMPLFQVQAKLVALACIPLVLACLIVSFLQTYFFLTSVRSSASLDRAFAKEFVSTASYVAVITLLILVPTLALIIVWVSHRIVGPMKRLESRLAMIAQGRIKGAFSFRDGDELMFVSDAVSRMEKGIHERLIALRQEVGRVEQVVAQLKSESSGGAAGRLDDLSQATEDLRARADAFELDEPL